MSWLLNTAYVLLLIFLSPVLFYRVLVLGKYRMGWGEKSLGRLPLRTSDAECVWFHAVSVGEVLQLQTVVRELAKSRPDWDIWITTTTHTGLAVAREKFPHQHVSFFPLDFSWAVKNAIHRLRPSAIVLVELELWPNFIRAASDAKIPLALINGRISENSFRGYKRIRFLMQNLLRRFDLLAVQSETYAERLKELGAPPERVHVTGSIKFDGVRKGRGNPQTQELRECFGLSEEDRVFIAGSTQHPEEAYALDTYQSLRQDFPNLRLILVPRHQERFEDVARLVEQREFSLIRRSLSRGQTRFDADAQRGRKGVGESLNRGTTDKPVLLLDTLGELSACWGLAEIAFVGGSLTNRGGQNMLEPAAYGAGVCFGPNTKNFRDVVELLLAQEAARVVADAAELTGLVHHWLVHPEESKAYGGRAQRLVLSQQGATARTVKLLETLRKPEENQTKRPAA